MGNQDIPAVTLYERPATPHSHPIGSDRTDQASERAGQADHHEVEPRRVGDSFNNHYRGQAAGKGHDDFAGQGDARGLDGHQEDHAHIAEIGYLVHDPRAYCLENGVYHGT